jgi:hypothetical protein
MRRHPNTAIRPQQRTVVWVVPPDGSARPGSNTDSTVDSGQVTGLTPAHPSKSAIMADAVQATGATARLG